MAQFQLQWQENIHHEINPKHLNDIKGWLTNSAASKNGNETNYDIDCQLELEELSDVIKNGSSPLN
jgi:hypothetical protein